MLSRSHRLKWMNGERAGLAKSCRLFLMLYFQDWIDRSLGYLTDNTQPTMLCITPTAALTLTVKRFSLLWPIAPFSIFFLTVKYFWMNSILNLNIENPHTLDILYLFFYILCISCMLKFCACFRKTGWETVTYVPQLHLKAALHNFQ